MGYTDMTVKRIVALTVVSSGCVTEKQVAVYMHVKEDGKETHV